MSWGRNRPRQEERSSIGITVGVTEVAWMYDRSRKWARSLLEAWEKEQKLGKGPIRVMRTGANLYTTMPVLHASLPPGKDLALYRRVEEVEKGLEAVSHQVERLGAEHGSLERRVGALEGRRR